MQKTTARRLRWTVPVIAGAAVAAAAILPGVAAGSDHPALPSRSAAQLLADVMAAAPPSLSGTLVETARLGLPALPSTGRTEAALTWQNLVTGSHTARIWMDGQQRQRVALVGDLAESDVVHNGTDVWVYSSTANTAMHYVLPSSAKGKAPATGAPEPLVTPSAAASDAIAAVGPTTRVTVEDTARVAGRAVYQIVLSPKDKASLVTAVTIALDSQTKIPLRVQVYGQDRTTPAFETTFTDVSFSKPPTSVFHFIPPTGAKVTLGSSLSGAVGGPVGVTKPGSTARAIGDANVGVPPKAGGSLARGLVHADSGSGFREIGSGWTAVLVADHVSLPGVSDGTGASSVGQLAGLLSKAATRVPQGLLLRTALLSVLLTNDGHLYVGAIDAASLQRAVTTGQAQ